jgi:hypothetical protein
MILNPFFIMTGITMEMTGKSTILPFHTGKSTEKNGKKVDYLPLRPLFYLCNHTGLQPL